MKNAIKILLALILVVALIGCAGQTKQQKGTGTGAAVGAGVGAILGQVIGGDTEGTLAGAGIGAVLGGIAGNRIGAYMDRQEQALQNAVASSEAASVRRQQDVLVTTFKSELMFDFDSATIKPGGMNEIARVAKVLNQYPQTLLRVEGHTDQVGPEDYNQRLSERRAEAVKNALIQQNVDPRRVSAIGYGESQPISSSDAVNRRVEIRITPIRQAEG
ncbi:outer membrane protein OmpA-like peptidoglycan-associated protein [Desulfosalsimonas propionicica]|uniref:Outer membrane protein OmpA-like peptidoglycan-associated protein n=1 Tax=Desulfosalsimonas propionicica TaxID=332175 RepID=A0A7W0HJS5_9BACT|nr:outer membrane protein OmpA-like peptidoglycan-associated protein [Desulfosalsimonas propionicica]